MSLEKKQRAALKALEFVQDEMIVGVGTGSTANCFIELLGTQRKMHIQGAVASSKETEQRLKAHGIPVFDLNSIDDLPLYVDGADQVNPHLQLIKGGGGALTREKIVATRAQRFICIVDDSKYVQVFGDFPLALEVLPYARSSVAREIVKMGGLPSYRENFITDNGNQIIDIYNLFITKPIELERKLNDIPGIVCNGMFALRPADLALVATDTDIKIYTR